MENSSQEGWKDQRKGRELTGQTCTAYVLFSGLALQNGATFSGAELRKEQEGEEKTDADAVVGFCSWGRGNGIKKEYR